MKFRGRKLRPWVENAVYILVFLFVFLLIGIAGGIETGSIGLPFGW